MVVAGSAMAQGGDSAKLGSGSAIYGADAVGAC